MANREEQALRGIVGAGASRVGTVGAMRARDVSRPTKADLEAAAESLVIRRAWRTNQPKEPQPQQPAMAEPEPPAENASRSSRKRRRRATRQSGSPT